MISEERISATFHFGRNGKLCEILLNAADDAGQEILEKAVGEMIKPDKKEWLRRFLRRCK